MILSALNGKPTVVERGGDHKIEYTYVLDTAEGIVKVHKAKKLKHTVYNTAGGKLNSLFETAEIVKKLIPKADIKISRARFQS